MSKYLDIVNWTEIDLDNLPSKETDEYEYKSSLIQKSKDYKEKLKEKIQKAASAFWNSGGGYFIVGYDEDTGIDGGIPPKMGKQGLPDWVDTIVHAVEPVGQYKTQLIEPNSKTSLIQAGNIVLVIGFAESHNLPHMASDNRYYIRAGAHSVPAKHFIVEALRAQRNVTKPMLFGNIRPSILRPDIFDFTISAVNNVPAINIIFTIHELPQQLARTLGTHFPMTVPMIDINTPFKMEFASYIFLSSWFKELQQKEMSLELSYTDLTGERYKEVQMLSPDKSIAPLQFGQTTEKILGDVHRELEAIRKWLQSKN